MTSFLRGCLPGDRPIPKASLSWLGTLALLTLPAACEIPTELPRWEQRWIVPAGETELRVEALLPPGTTLNADSTLFLFLPDTLEFSRSLEDLCPPCIPLWGLRDRKPAFQDEFGDRFLRTQLVSAEVEEGSMLVNIRNGFNFDPIRPDSAVFGEIVITIRAEGPPGATLNQVQLKGEDIAFPPFTEETVLMGFSGRVKDGGRLQVAVDSPEGDSLTIDIHDFLSITASIDTVKATSAVVEVKDGLFFAEPMTLHTGGLSEVVLDRLQSGALVLEISNPWWLAADLDLTILAPSRASLILKEVSMPGAEETTLRVEFTAEELRDILGGAGATMSIVAEVGPGANDVSAVPGQKLTLRAKFDLVLSTEGAEG